MGQPTTLSQHTRNNTSPRNLSRWALLLPFVLLSCSPAHPRFAHRTSTDPGSHLERAAALPDGSVRRDRAIAHAIEALAAAEGPPPPTLDVKWHGRPYINPLTFDHTIASRTVIRRSWRRVWHDEEGIGSPLVLLGDEKEDRHVGNLGEVLALTAVLEPETTGSKRNTLHLYDGLSHGAPSTPHARQPLARDFTAPLAYMLRRDDLIPELRALFQAERFLDDLGLYRFTPFDPNKIPVVLVHGLTSSRQVWANLANELVADPEIRERYQLWAFSYPTGVPILYSAMRLRQELQHMREHYDPDDTNPNLNNMVLVGHSMGGILSRLMISESNDRLADWTNGSLNELVLPEDVERLTKEMLVFEPQRYIGRAVFIAAPHRGSNIAGLKIVQRATSLIKVPRELKSALLTTLQLNPNIGLIPDSALQNFNSVGDLRPYSNFMKAMAEQPPAPGVPYHSIIAIGKNGRDKPLVETDDGLVAYPSAHLDGAQSEITVADKHNVFDHPETIAEVARILRLHR
jgi:hypothetical protein